MDDDLDALSRDELVAEVKRLRQGVRKHRDSTGHELCWHHPALWSLLPEATAPEILVPEWPQFMRGCIRYRQSLDDQAPTAPRTGAEPGASDAGAAKSMTEFATLRLPAHPTVIAPDGSDVRVLLSLPAGSMAHFELAPGQVAHAVTHRTVEEVWYVLAGRGEMWRKQANREETVALEPGVCLTIPRGTHFQFRASYSEPVSAVAVTMPPWPGAGEAAEAAGPWPPSRSEGGEP